MEKTVLILPDGTEISSGDTTKTAIVQATMTENYNEKQELEPGTVASAVIELTLLTHGSAPELSSGTRVTVYREEDGFRRLVGKFISQKPQKKSANTYAVTLCDNVSLLDRDLTGWVNHLDGWPYTLAAFGSMVCSNFGLELYSGKALNSRYSVHKFSAANVTGRQLMVWVCQAAGVFCRANTNGDLVLDWYENMGGSVVPDDKMGYYFQNSLSFSDFSTEPITRVRLRQNGEDVGVSYPKNAASRNELVITGNPLLSGDSESLEAVAMNLYERIHACTYTPCSLAVPRSSGVTAGQIFTVTDTSGKTIRTLAMSVKQTGDKLTVSSTGSIRRDSSGSSSLSYRSLSGRVMELSTTVDGIRAENRDMSGKSAALELSIAGIKSEVSRQNQSVGGLSSQLTALQQTAEKIKLSVKTIQQNGTDKVETSTGYTFDADGLHIQKSGQEMENKLTDTGMYVYRSGTPMLKADKDGVVATDVSVRNYLIIGKHARVEDYSDGMDSKRTAVYWI